MAYLKCESPALNSQAATKSYVDTNAGSVATTEQVVIVNFDKGDYNGVVTSDGSTQYAVMSSSFQIPDGSYVTGCGVWVDPADPWPATAEIIVGDVTTPEPAGPPPAPAGNVMPDRWMDKTSNAASTGGVYFKANWDRLTDNTAKTIFVCIAAAENAQLLTGNCQVFLKYVETPRT